MEVCRIVYHSYTDNHKDAEYKNYSCNYEVSYAFHCIIVFKLFHCYVITHHKTSALSRVVFGEVRRCGASGFAIRHRRILARPIFVAFQALWCIAPAFRAFISCTFYSQIIHFSGAHDFATLNYSHSVYLKGVHELTAFVSRLSNTSANRGQKLSLLRLCRGAALYGVLS